MRPRVHKKILPHDAALIVAMYIDGGFTTKEMAAKLSMTTYAIGTLSHIGLLHAVAEGVVSPDLLKIILDGKQRALPHDFSWELVEQVLDRQYPFFDMYGERS